MMNKYPLKPNKILKKNIKKYFKYYDDISDQYWENVNDLEKLMQKETGIEDIEFFFVDGEFAGIGNRSRTIKLIPRK